MKKIEQTGIIRFGTLRAAVIAAATVPWALAGCAPAPVEEQVAQAADADAGVLESTREAVWGHPDLYHYSWLLRVGATPNAHIRVHRLVYEAGPWLPRPTAPAAMLMHGDFASFVDNFAPVLAGAPAPPDGGLGVYLADRGIDVWGLDRRWATVSAAQTDLSDFAHMTYAQEVSDIGTALSFARGVRGTTGEGDGPIILSGFSRGAHLAYVFAEGETQIPPSKRQVRALAPIDMYAKLSPADDALRQFACANSAAEYQGVAQGMFDSPNTTIIQIGQLDETDPNDTSPIFGAPYTNHTAFLGFVGQTYLIDALTPVYHLVGATLSGGNPTALRWSAEPVIDAWLSNAPVHEPLVEEADGDALWCDQAPLPLPDHLAQIQVPLFYLGAAGGVGAHGLYTTTLVASTDVTTHVVQRLPQSQQAGDYGHGDLLYAPDSVDLAWEPLATWMIGH
jgi:hypothetical protein